MEVGWIGLGAMGLPTAKKVAAAGHRVRGYDPNPPAPEDAAGLIVAASAREAAKDCELLCIAVFSDAQVLEVLNSPAGVLSGLRPGAVVAIFTTGSIESMRQIAAIAPPGVTILDTCFSRQFADFATQMLTLLVGGATEAIERARPAFDAFARDIIHVGGIGSGRAIKLVNNLLYAGQLQLAADALRFAEGLGLEEHATLTALTRCSGASDALEQFLGMGTAQMLDLAHRYMVKDVAAAAEAARNAGVDLQTLGKITDAYRPH